MRFPLFVLQSPSHMITSLVTSSCYLDSGDRTPKQKVKLKVTEEKLLNLMLKYNGGRPRSEVIP